MLSVILHILRMSKWTAELRWLCGHCNWASGDPRRFFYVHPDRAKGELEIEHYHADYAEVPTFIQFDACN